jgi:hypothetical protein
MKHTIVTRRRLSTMAFSFTLLFCMAFSANAFDTSDFLVHVGGDAQWRYVPLKDNFGNNLVKRDYLQTGAYAGMRFFDDSLGFECGYQRSNSVSRTTDVSDASSYFSSTLPTGTYTSSTKVYMQNIYGALVGLLPISEVDRLKLIASIGAGRTRTRMTADLAGTAGTAVTAAWPLSFKAIKWVPKANIGLQWMASQHLGFRALAGWEQTAQFNRIRANNADQTANTKYFASFKNAASCGLGLFYSF